MKRNHFWFMLEGLLCGGVQILVWEFALSATAVSIPWLRVAVPVLGVLLTAVGFFFLMRRFPATKKKTKFWLGFFAYAVIQPAWLVYSAAFGWAIFPHRSLAEGEYSSLATLLGLYTLSVVVSRIAVIVYYYIRKKRRKKQV